MHICIYTYLISIVSMLKNMQTCASHMQVSKMVTSHCKQCPLVMVIKSINTSLACVCHKGHKLVQTRFVRTSSNEHLTNCRVPAASANAATAENLFEQGSFKCIHNPCLSGWVMNRFVDNKE